MTTAKEAIGTTHLTGHAAGRAVITQADTWAPDRRIGIRYEAAQSDVVLVLFSLSGTHTGPFQDIAPSHKRFSVWLADVFRFDDQGRMIEGWVIGKADLRATLAALTDGPFRPGRRPHGLADVRGCRRRRDLEPG